MDDVEIIREFLVESSENLARLDQEMIELEQRPGDAALLASIFRTIHTIKGTCGFLGFSALESITHSAENLLSQIRNGEKQLTPALVTIILATVDAVRAMLATIEATGQESTEDYSDLKATLEAAVAGQPAPLPAPKPAAPPPAQPPTQKAASEAAEEPAAPAKPSLSVTDSTIRVDVSLLDKLVTMVGELVLARNQILQAPVSDNPALQATSQRLDLITSELQEGIMRTRMQPVGVVWNKLPRVVRDLAASCGKQIAIEMEGAATEIDKTIIEAIKDPLTHLVRNACDHGLEPPAERIACGKSPSGRLGLRAWHEGGNVKIEISDDGAGIDPARIRRKAVQKGLLREEEASRLTDREAVNLVFAPGFSTAEQVTNISGRGVGMDVVRTNIEKIGGSIDLSSTVGQGTSVQIRIPLTLAIIPGLLVHSAGERFIIPQVSLVELVRFDDNSAKEIQTIRGRSVFRRRAGLAPLVSLREVLQMGEPTEAAEALNIAVLQAENSQFGLMVDSIGDTQEIVVKALGRQLRGLACYAGATIMGDGRVALILDVMGIATLSGVLSETASLDAVAGRRAGDSTGDDVRSWLLFRAGQNTRIAAPLDLVARLEEVPVQSVEYAGGRMAIQYRGDLLRLVSVADAFGYTPGVAVSDVLQVIVISHGERSIGLVVDEILDVVEGAVGNAAPTSHSLLLGAAILDGKLTDLLDLGALIEASEPGWFDGSRPRRHSTVLLADSSDFVRTVGRHALEVEGYRVVEARSPEEVLRWLDRRNVDAVVLGSGMDCPEAAGRAPVLPWQGPVSGRHTMLTSLQNLLEAVEDAQSRQEVA